MDSRCSCHISSSGIPHDISHHIMLFCGHVLKIIEFVELQLLFYGHGLKIINIVELQLAIGTLEPNKNNEVFRRRLEHCTCMSVPECCEPRRMANIVGCAQQIDAYIVIRPVTMNNSKPVASALPHKADYIVILGVQFKDWDGPLLDHEQLKTSPSSVL